ncbi:unnamed protein product [Caenorhabditis brenneri]
MDKRNGNNQGGGRKETEKGKGPHHKKGGAKNAPVVQNAQHAKNSNGGNRGNSGNGGNGGNSGVGEKKGGSFGAGGDRGSSGSGEKQGKPGIVENVVNSGTGTKNGKSVNGSNCVNSGNGGNRAQSDIGNQRGSSGTGGNAGAASDRKAVDTHHAQNVGGPEERSRQHSDSFNSRRPTLPYHKGSDGQKPLMNVSKHSEKPGNGADFNHQERTSNLYGQHANKKNNGGMQDNAGNGGGNRGGFGGQQPLMKNSSNYHQEGSSNSYGIGNQKPLMNYSKHSEKPGNGGGNFHQEGTSNTYGQHANKKNTNGMHDNAGNGEGNHGGFGGQQPLMKNSSNYHQEGSSNSYGGQNPLKNSGYPGNGTNSFHQEGSSNSYGQHTNKKNSGGAHGNGGNGGGNRGGFGGQQPLMKNSSNYHQEGSSNSYRNEEALSDDALRRVAENLSQIQQTIRRHETAQAPALRKERLINSDAFGFGHQEIGFCYETVHQEDTSTATNLVISVNQEGVREVREVRGDQQYEDQSRRTSSDRDEHRGQQDDRSSQNNDSRHPERSANQESNREGGHCSSGVREAQGERSSRDRDSRHHAMNSRSYVDSNRQAQGNNTSSQNNDSRGGDNHATRPLKNDNDYPPFDYHNSVAPNRGRYRSIYSSSSNGSRSPTRDVQGSSSSQVKNTLDVREAQGERSSRDRDSRHHTMNSRNSVDTKRQTQGNNTSSQNNDSRGGDNHATRPLKTDDDYPPFDYHNSVAPNRGRYRSIYSSSSNGSRSPTRDVQGSSSSHAKNTEDDYPPYDPHNSVAPSTRRNLLPFYSPVRRNHEGSSSSQAKNDVEDYPLNPPTSSAPSRKYPSWGDNSVREEPSYQTTSEIEKKHAEEMTLLRHEMIHYKCGVMRMTRMIENLLKVEGVRKTLMFAGLGEFETLEECMTKYTKFP